MQMKIWLYLCVLAVIAGSCSEATKSEVNGNRAAALTTSQKADEGDVGKVRTKRGVFWDIFQKMVTTKNLVVDQYVDTRDTFSEIYNLLNEGFSDPAPAKPTSRPPTTKQNSNEDDSSDEMRTTTEKYAISRYELGRILGRNFRGLQRLTKIEFQDAFNASHYNIMEYKAEAQKQFANSLAVEKKKKLQQLVG